jgi:hypothetical protein
MNCLAPSAEFEGIVPRNSLRERMRSALHLFAGRGRRYSVIELGIGADVNPKHIERAMRPVDAPDHRPLKHEELASVAKFLGAQFASIYMELSGLGAFELADGQPPLPKVLSSAPAQEDASEERKRLIRRLAELEGVQ